MGIRIRIQQLKLMRIHADPDPDTDTDTDPKPWILLCSEPVTCVTRVSTPGQDCGNIGWSTLGRDRTMIDWID